MVKFVPLGLATLAATKAEPAPEGGFDVLSAISTGWQPNPEGRPSSVNAPTPEGSMVIHPVGVQTFQPVATVVGTAFNPPTVNQVFNTPLINNNPFSTINRPSSGINYQPYQPPSMGEDYHRPVTDIKPAMQAQRPVNQNQWAAPNAQAEGAPPSNDLWMSPQNQPSRPTPNLNSNRPVNFTPNGEGSNPYNPNQYAFGGPPANPFGHPTNANNGIRNPNPYGPGHGPAPTTNGQQQFDYEHSQVVDLNSPGVVTGTDVIKTISYRADGNYKLEINLEGTIPLEFVDLIAGKCNALTPGVSIINAGNYNTQLEIDMGICQKECDLENYELLSTIDVLNQPIDITFGIKDPEMPDQVIGNYHIRPNPMYHEDYILEFNTETEETRQLVIDESGNFFQVDDNIQFSFMTFMDDSFTVKTYSTKASAPPGHTTFLEMCPTNGFTVGKMINVPEICFIKDLTNDKTVMMWDMGIDNGCVANLRYQPATGNWQYPTNYYQIMGYSTQNTHHNSFKITCNMRVCGNVAGNPCEQQIDNCDYIW